MNGPSQAAQAQTVFRDLADSYETDSWYPFYATRFMKVANVQPGERILDLGCGTGLATVIAAKALATRGNPNDGGAVTGIDCSPEMMSAAKYKVQQQEPSVRGRVAFFLHDVTTLDQIERRLLPRCYFDMIYCSNAFTLLHGPEAVLHQWRRYLKPPCPLHGLGRNYSHHFYQSFSHGGACNGFNGRGYRPMTGRLGCRNQRGGRLVIDIPHRRFELGTLAMERVASRLGLRFPSNRSWIDSDTAIFAALRRHGYRVVTVIRLHGATGRPSEYCLEDALTMFDSMARSSRFQAMLESAPPGFLAGASREEVVQQCREMFREQMTNLAESGDGTIRENDMMDVYVARRLW